MIEGSIAVVSVTPGPVGLVTVRLRLPTGSVRTLSVPRRLAGVQEVEWATAAVAALVAASGGRS